MRVYIIDHANKKYQSLEDTKGGQVEEFINEKVVKINGKFKIFLVVQCDIDASKFGYEFDGGLIERYTMEYNSDLKDDEKPLEHWRRFD